MIIKWFGLNAVQIKSHNRIVAVDPFSDKTGLKAPTIKADILLLTNRSPEIDPKKVQSRKGGKLFTIDGPGEYEIKEVMIKGIPSLNTTIYTIYSENISVGHLDGFSQKELTNQQLEELNKVDILLLPVGNKNILSGEEAADLAQQIEPKVIIPIYFQLKGLKKKLESPEKFLKNEGVEKIEPQPELKISKSSLPKEETEVVILKP